MTLITKINFLDKYKTRWLVFTIAFLFALVAMIAAREIVISKMNLVAESGNLAGDPQVYNTVALKKLSQMEAEGLKEFEFRPEGSGPAGIASLSYYFFDSVYGVIVINALLHALSVLCIFLILSFWFHRNIAFVASIPFLVSPYMMVWYSQINKDSYAGAGSLLLILGFLKLLHVEGFKKYAQAALIALSGVLLIFLVRPYLNKINFMFFTCVFLVSLFFSKYKKSVLYILFSSLVLIAMLLMCRGVVSDQTIESFQYYSFKEESDLFKGDIVRQCLKNVSVETWQANSKISFIDNNLKALSGQRCLIFTLLNDKTNKTTLDSMVDYDILPNSTLEALAYLPRAAAYGNFAPWPDRWLYVFNKHLSMFYLIVPFETLILYLGYIAIFLNFLCQQKKQWTILVPIFISMGVMSIYGMSTPFIGALYRYRYPWWMLMIGLSIISIIQVSSKILKRKTT